MFENQPILILSSIFACIYTGLFIRYFIISKGLFSLSKFILVKFFTRTIILVFFLFLLNIMNNNNEKTINTEQVYITTTNQTIKLSNKDLINRIQESIKLNTKINRVGLLYSNVFGHYLIIPTMQKVDFLNYINRFEIKNLPKLKINKIPESRIYLYQTSDENTSENNNIIYKISSYFNLYIISKLRIYLLILIIFLLGIDLLFVRKNIKS